MPLPTNYSEWPAAAQQRYRAMRVITDCLRDYADISDDEAARINHVIHECQRLDVGDGLLFEKAGALFKKRYLTQTFH